MVSFTLWFGFIAFLIAALVLDLGLFNKKNHVVSFKESVFWTVVWTTLAIVFKYILDANLGPAKGNAFLTGYLLERILSVDNIFIFLLIFSYFKVPAELQQKALMVGIIFAIILRAVFIALGTELVHSFEWILYVFGAFLVYTGIKIMLPHEEHDNLDHNKVVIFCKKYFGVASRYEGSKIFTLEGGKKVLTMFGLAVIVIATSDIIFAVDSIPAIFSITQDTYIIFTANVFSVLGLRAIFFLIANVINSFYYLKHALSLILTFVGVKMLIIGFYHVDIIVSLCVIIATFLVAIIASVVRSLIRR